MNFPVDNRDPENLSSEIVPIDDRADGRKNVRAWVRTYNGTGAAIYVALYATHCLDDQPYMNIAFPLSLEDGWLWAISSHPRISSRHFVTN